MNHLYALVVIINYLQAMLYNKYLENIYLNKLSITHILYKYMVFCNTEIP